MTARRVATSDKYYEHSQGVPSTEWVIDHNLGKYPAVGVLDTANTALETKIVHDSIYRCRALFKAATSGKATCS